MTVQTIPVKNNLEGDTKIGGVLDLNIPQIAVIAILAIFILPTVFRALKPKKIWER